MNYNGTIYRPPVEANTFLLPITEGCTHNRCAFCNMYQDVPFRMLSLSEVEEYLREMKQSYGRYCERIQRVYLVGADPFALSANRLLERIELIKKYLPNTKVITMYARTDNIASKSDEDLKALQEAGVDDLYIGVECGLNDVLEKLNKGYSADETKAQCLRLNAVGIRHCDLLISLAVYFDVSTDYLLMGRDYVNLHSRKRLESVLQELSGIIADLQDV